MASRSAEPGVLPHVPGSARISRAVSPRCGLLPHPIQCATSPAAHPQPSAVSQCRALLPYPLHCRQARVLSTSDHTLAFLLAGGPFPHSVAVPTALQHVPAAPCRVPVRWQHRSWAVSCVPLSDHPS